MHIMAGVNPVLHCMTGEICRDASSVSRFEAFNFTDTGAVLDRSIETSLLNRDKMRREDGHDCFHLDSDARKKLKHVTHSEIKLKQNNETA